MHPSYKDTKHSWILFLHKDATYEQNQIQKENLFNPNSTQFNLALHVILEIVLLLYF